MIRSEKMDTCWDGAQTRPREELRKMLDLSSWLQFLHMSPGPESIKLIERERDLLVTISAANTIMNESDREINLTRQSNSFWILSLKELVSCSAVVGKFTVQHAFFFVNFLSPPPTLWLTSRSLGLWTIPLDLESARGPGPESPRTLVGM